MFFSTTIPVFSVRISGDPPVLYVITGNPQAKASIFTVGKVSCFVKLINASLALYISHNSLTVFVLGIHNAFSIVVVFEDNVPPTTTIFIFSGKEIANSFKSYIPFVVSQTLATASTINESSK